MSFLIKTLKPKQILDIYRAASALQARQGHFFPEYKPAEAPKTEEERIAAAKKYNLLPEEYEPYPEDDGYGDYPKLPFESVDSKDPWYPWDNEELRKDFGEPVHVRMINLIPETVTTAPPPIPYSKQVFYYLSACSIVGTILYFLGKLKTIHPISERQLVTPGVTHYTFEPDLDEEIKRKEKKKKKCEAEEE